MKQIAGLTAPALLCSSFAAAEPATTLYCVVTETVEFESQFEVRKENNEFEELGFLYNFHSGSLKFDRFNEETLLIEETFGTLEASDFWHIAENSEFEHVLRLEISSSDYGENFVLYMMKSGPNNKDEVWLGRCSLFG